MAGLRASQDVLRSAQIAALEGYVAAGATKLEEAVEHFCKPVEDKAKHTEQASDVEDALTTSWKAIIASAANDSWTWPIAQKLADFVVEVEDRPDVQQNGRALQVEGMTVWKDLPTFGWQLRDAWNFAADDDSDQEDKIRWIALNGFTASLVTRLYSKVKSELDVSLFGLWTIRRALEESDKPSNAAVSAASVWFVGAAPAIWEFSRKEKSFQGKVAKPGSLYKDEAWTGFSSDRWRVWSKRFGELQDQVSDAATVRLLHQARQAISLAEK